MTVKERIDDLREFVSLTSAYLETHPEFTEKTVVGLDIIREHIDVLENELGGDREWGIKYPNGYIGFVGTKENASFGISDSSVLVSRRKAGPWEENPCPK